MDYVKDFLSINKEVFSKSLSSLKNNILIILTGIIYVIINIVIVKVVLTLFTGILSIFAGIALAIVSASLISNYLYLLFNIINYDKITIQDFKDGFTYFLRKVYTIFFFAWIGSYALELIQGIIGINPLIVNLIITISVFVLLNPLPETLYLKVLDPMDSIMYSIDFMKENWINWLIPNIILYTGIYYLTGNIITGIFNTYIYSGLSLSGFGILKYLGGQILFSFTMIYRGYLFKLLSTSTRRKRMYMNKFRD